MPCAAFPSWWKDDSLILMLDFGMDESGDTKVPGKLLVVSAQIGATSQLKKMSKLWQADLDKYGVPYFHAKELWNRQSKLYKGLSNTKRGALLSGLIEHSGKYVNWGYTAHINVDEYRRETTPRYRSQWGSAYTFAMQLVFIGLYMKLETLNRKDETVNVLIEDGHVNAIQALENVRSMRKRKDRGMLNIGNYGLAGKKDNPILQAADVLAYGSCQHFCGRSSSIFNKLRATGRTEITIINCSKAIPIMKDSVARYFEMVRTGEMERL